jgi:hypothetical protein
LFTLNREGCRFHGQSTEADAKEEFCLFRTTQRLQIDS